MKNKLYFAEMENLKVLPTAPIPQEKTTEQVKEISTTIEPPIENLITNTGENVINNPEKGGYNNYDLFKQINEPDSKENITRPDITYYILILERYGIKVPEKIEGKHSLYNFLLDRLLLSKLGEKEGNTPNRGVVISSSSKYATTTRQGRNRQCQATNSSFYGEKGSRDVLLTFAMQEFYINPIPIPIEEDLIKTIKELVQQKIITDSSVLEKRENSVPKVTFTTTFTMIKTKFTTIVRDVKRYLTEMVQVHLNDTSTKKVYLT